MALSAEHSWCAGSPSNLAGGRKDERFGVKGMTIGRDIAEAYDLYLSGAK